MYDVVVIGGGPVGSYIASKLAGLGRRVAVLERKERLGEPVCCTGIIGRECVDSFAVPGDVILRWIDSASLFSPSAESIHLQRHQPFAAIVDRAAFDLTMAVRARDRGAEYLLDTPAVSLQVNSDMVKIEAARQGESAPFEARAVVIANGFNSRLADGLGLGRVTDFIVGAQAEVAAPSLEEVEIYFDQQLASGFFAWLVPTLPQRALAGLALHRGSARYMRKLLALLADSGKIASPDVTPGYRPIPIKPLPKTYSERVVVVGDSAGQVKPTTGGGIYYGLLCADVAADTLHLALQDNDLSARRLATYEQGWRRKLGQELRVDYYARKLYERLTDRQIDRAFDLVKSNHIDQALLEQDGFFDWHGKTILKILGHRAISATVSAVKSHKR